MGDGSIFKIRGRDENRKIEVKLFAERIEFHKSKFIGTYLSDTIRYEHVASVSARRGMLASTVTVETSGGRRFVINLVPKTEADRFIVMVNHRITETISAMRGGRVEALTPPTSLMSVSPIEVAHAPAIPPSMPRAASLTAQLHPRHERTFLLKIGRVLVTIAIVVVVGFVALAGLGMYLATRLPQRTPDVPTVPASVTPTASPTTVAIAIETVAAPAEIASPSVQAPPTPPSPDIAFDEVERVRLPYLIVAVKTAATTEPAVRRVVDRMRRTALRDEAMFEIRFYPSTIAKITPIRETLNGKAGLTWQAELLAEYSFNRNSGLDEITMHVADETMLPIEGVKATELLRNRITKIQIAAVVHVDRLTSEVAMKVGKYYEDQAKDVEYLHVYLTDSDEKWTEYPNVYPATVPPQIGLVYDRGPRSPGHVVKGNEFK